MDIQTNEIENARRIRGNLTHVFIDIETTGASRLRDEIWQLAWIVDKNDASPVERSYFVEHSCKPNQWVLENTSYKSIEADSWQPLNIVAQTLLDDANVDRGNGRTVLLVGANPSFESTFLSRIFEPLNTILPWDYRFLDVESLLAGALRLPFVPSLKESCAILGIAYPSNAHDALSDARITREVFRRIANLGPTSPH